MEITPEENAERTDFIREIVREDLRTGKYAGRVQTRFPPEPNGYLHIGHAKSICLNFGIAGEFGGKCNLRFDDTNPTKEEVEYVEFDHSTMCAGWASTGKTGCSTPRITSSSSTSMRVKLIQKGKAYVDDLSAEEIREYRGTLTEPGKESPYRNRTGGGEPGSVRAHAQGRVPGWLARAARQDRHGLRQHEPARPGDVPHPAREPPPHRRQPGASTRCTTSPTGSPTRSRGITHSICTLEFEDHRPLYDWFLDELEIYHPQQIEFARLNLTYTVLSKRKLLRLVQEGHVRGWDDPRMPTLSGLRRRGYTPEAIRDFCERIGVAKNDSIVDIALLEYCVREDLNQRAPRVMAVLRPLKVVIDNYPG